LGAALSTENGVSYAHHISVARLQAVYRWNELQAQQQHPMMPRQDGCKCIGESRSNRGIGNDRSQNCSVASAKAAVLAATVAAAAAEGVLQQLPVSQPGDLPSDDA